ncbi:MAG: hypothetical protein M3425_09535 [Actinomycetota bacterium]|nr:hypothetical protein [Actinomycetota bacterium]
MTAATWRLRPSWKTAQAWSGHKTASVLLDTYLGVIRGDEDLALSRFEALLHSHDPPEGPIS